LIIVKLKVSKALTTEHWKQMAIGTEDQYGNPFRIIKLRWNKNPMHKMAEYTKTRGFEDAMISKDSRTSDIAISYRRNGSVMWQQPPGGVGPFTGELANTPRNLRRLAAMYGDRLFTIMDADIDKIVRSMYEEVLKDIPKNKKEFHDRRIRNLHRMAMDDEDKKSEGKVEIPLDIERISLSEKTRLAQIKQMELDKREEALNMRESALGERAVDDAREGVLPVAYSREFLGDQKMFELRRICTEVGAVWDNSTRKDALIEKVISRQEGKNVAATEAVKETAEALDI